MSSATEFPKVGKDPKLDVTLLEIGEFIYVSQSSTGHS